MTVFTFCAEEIAQARLWAMVEGANPALRSNNGDRTSDDSAPSAV